MKNTMHRLLLLLTIMFVSAGSYAASSEKTLEADIPNVTAEMRSAGFWIDRHPYPDKLVMNPSRIEYVNSTFVKSGLIEDLAAFSVTYDGEKLKGEIREAYQPLKKRPLFKADGAQAPDDLFSKVEEEMDLGALPTSVKPRFGFVISPASERLAPTNDLLSVKSGDLDFDEVQNSGLDIATPVVVLHQGKSGQWVFVKDTIASGWVRSDSIVYFSREDVAAYLHRRDIAVVTEPRADIYLDRGMKHYYGTVRMGARLVLRNPVGRAIEILLPERAGKNTGRMVSGFIARDDVSIGYLSFTPRAIYRQAFKMLGKPYGWGDANGGQDCSRFIQMVFATVGLSLPRNSREQGQVGLMLDGFKEDLAAEDKAAVIVGDGVGALTLLRLNGHIMLYLGDVNEKPYAIHATWSYRERTGSGEIQHLLRRVVVTDLDLGAGASKGSLVERIISARVIER